MSALRSENELIIEDFLFTEEQICQVVELKEHIFEIKKTATSLGFISLYDLKPLFVQSESFGNEYQIKNINEDNWTAVCEHFFFQRRKPQLVALDTLETLQEENDHEYFILRHGQKEGPFEKIELDTSLEAKKLLLTDLVSTNGGRTWMKLYQIDGFDRRSLSSSDQLPGLPSDSVFKSSGINPEINKPETEALSSLAYLGNVKRGKVIEREKSMHYQQEMTKKTGNSNIYKWLLALSVMGIGIFLYNIRNQLLSPFGTSQSPIGEQSEMLTPVEFTPEQAGYGGEKKGRKPAGQYNDSRRSGKFDARTLQPIRPNQRKSFMENAKYQEIQNPDAEEDSNYFYDNSSAMELDPIRSQISKENYEGPVGEPAPLEVGDTLFDEEVSR